MAYSPLQRSLLRLAVCLALVPLASRAQEVQAPAPSDENPATPTSVATRTQTECSGFIAEPRLPDTTRVFDGADNDLYQPLTQFTVGSYVYLRDRTGKSFTVGSRYSIVRPELGYQLSDTWKPGQLEDRVKPRLSWYPRQRSHIRALGQPYADAGEVKVIKVTPEGAVAQVEFSCGPIHTGDIAIPYQPRPAPPLVMGTALDRFASPNGKMRGTIVAAGGAGAYLGQGTIAYLDLGERDGARPGQRYRIFAVFRDKMAPLPQQVRSRPPTPRESVGELVILSTQARSAVGLVVTSTREITVGDGVELE